MVRAGGFEMGQEGDAESYCDENPAHQVEINYEFAISTYEVTNAQYAAFLNSPAVAPATPGILVRLLDAGGLPLGEAYTDDAGDYRLYDPAPAEGAYAVAVYADGVLLETRAIDFHEASVREDFQPYTPDLDHDGDVDQSDFGRLQECLSGRGAIQNEPRCIEAHLDGDEDVDSRDVEVFLACRSGPGQLFDTGCYQ